MATYRAAMGPALEYATSIWSPLASSTSMNKLQVMHNAGLPLDAHKTQTYNICMTKQTPHFTYTDTIPDIITNMRHMHTSIDSRHQSTRGNNKILRTTPPHSSSEEILPHLTRRTLIQLRKNQSQIILTQSRRQITSITTMPIL